MLGYVHSFAIEKLLLFGGKARLMPKPKPMIFMVERMSVKRLLEGNFLRVTTMPVLDYF
jgi:hypothetical protein